MQAITAMRARVDGAGGLADTLATGWDAFELVRAVALGCADRSDSLFAAFMMAAASAADGRDLVGFAPSLPPGRATGTGPAATAAGDPGEIAGGLAALALALHDRLLPWASGAADAGDRSSCADAARAAGQVRRLLARDG